MKNSFFRWIACWLVIFLSFACTNSNDALSDDIPAPKNTYEVTPQEALAIANGIFCDPQKNTRSHKRRVVSNKRFVPKKQTRSASGDEAAFYIINYADNEGFALISADKRATPVYAYSGSGNLQAEDFEENPGLKIFMKDAIHNFTIEIDSSKIRHPIELPDPKYDDIIRLPKVTIDGKQYYCWSGIKEEIIVDPLVPVAWHQGHPYNYYCYPCVTGCGPTAIAQIMAYYKYPASFNGHNYDWDAMTAQPSFSGITPASLNIAQLMVDIGIDSKADYGIEWTSTYRTNSRETFCHFGYNCSLVSDYNFSTVIETLKRNHPVWIRGTNPKGGHAWVVDGYSLSSQKTIYYYTYEPYDIFYYTTDSVYTCYFHCNWGWDNDQNGYYLTFMDYQYSSLAMIYDIKPNL